MVDLSPVISLASRVHPHGQEVTTLTRLGRVATAVLVGSQTCPFRERSVILNPAWERAETHAVLVRVLAARLDGPVVVHARSQRADAVELGACARGVVRPERVVDGGGELERRRGEMQGGRDVLRPWLECDVIRAGRNGRAYVFRAPPRCWCSFVA